MIHINLVYEDRLSEAVLRTILEQSKNNFEVHRCFPDPSRQHSSYGSGYIKSRINEFNHAAKAMPFLVLTDLDTAECSPLMINQWLTERQHPNLIFRVAEREVESWVMADRVAFSDFLAVPLAKIPVNIDDSIEDPKAFLIKLAHKSKKNTLKKAIIPPPGRTVKIGPGYNRELTGFVKGKWRLEHAVKHSISLRRAAKALGQFQPV